MENSEPIQHLKPRPIFRNLNRIFGLDTQSVSLDIGVVNYIIYVIFLMNILIKMPDIVIKDDHIVTCL